VAQCDASGERRVRPFTGRFEAVEAREVVGDVLVGLDLVPAGDRRLVVRAPVLAVARRRVRVPVGTPLFEIGYTVEDPSAVTVEGPEEPDSIELLPSSPPLSLPVPLRYRCRYTRQGPPSRWRPTSADTFDVIPRSPDALSRVTSGVDTSKWIKVVYNRLIYPYI